MISLGIGAWFIGSWTQTNRDPIIPNLRRWFSRLDKRVKFILKHFPTQTDGAGHGGYRVKTGSDDFIYILHLKSSNSVFVSRQKNIVKRNIPLFFASEPGKRYSANASLLIMFAGRYNYVSMQIYGLYKMIHE